MFGITMDITHNDTSVRLRAFSKEDLPVLVAHFSSVRVHLLTKGLFAQTIENETEWYEKRRQSKEDVTWAIVPLVEGWGNTPIGVTSLHDITSINNTSVSGIIIWNPEWWGKGIASACHLGRTLFAADYLSRWKINSCVRVENAASRRALEKVGYTVWGTEPCTTRKAGRWMDTHHLIWIHPEVKDFLFPLGVPDQYIEGIKKAESALAIARHEVSFP